MARHQVWWGRKVFGGDHGPYRQVNVVISIRNMSNSCLTEEKLILPLITWRNLEARSVRRLRTSSMMPIHEARCVIQLTISKEDVDKLIADGNQYVVRFKVEPGEAVHVNDLIRGDVRIMSDILDDKVLYKSADEPYLSPRKYCRRSSDGDNPRHPWKRWFIGYTASCLAIPVHSVGKKQCLQFASSIIA